MDSGWVDPAQGGEHRQGALTFPPVSGLGYRAAIATLTTITIPEIVTEHLPMTTGEHLMRMTVKARGDLPDGFDKETIDPVLEIPASKPFRRQVRPLP